MPYGELPRYCHACDARIEGEEASSGLLVWVRGDDVVYEEPPLCPQCSRAIGMTWLYRLAETEGDDG
jgi:hypothetical protein